MRLCLTKIPGVQSEFGKVSHGVSNHAKTMYVPIMVKTGGVEGSAQTLNDIGVKSYRTIQDLHRTCRWTFKGV